MNVVSKEYSLNHYQWGNDCDGWSFVEEPSLSVKMECMPPGTTEVRHYHQRAQQFFYILKGEAQFDIEDKTIILKAGQGILVMPCQKHRIFNTTGNELEFLLTSQPSAIDDRLDG